MKGWKCSDCPSRKFVAYSDEVVRWHLRGFDAENKPFEIGAKFCYNLTDGDDGVFQGSLGGWLRLDNTLSSKPEAVTGNFIRQEKWNYEQKYRLHWCGVYRRTDDGGYRQDES